MKAKATSVTAALILLLLISQTGYTQEFIKELLDPSNKAERPPEVPIGFDFDDVIFDREYFYSTTQGLVQYRNTGSGLWNSLELNLKKDPNEEPLREAPPESIPKPPESAAAGGDDVRTQITKPGAEPPKKKRKTREEILRELEKTVGVPRH